MDEKDFLSVVNSIFGLQHRQQTPYCQQFLLDGKVVVEWWQSTGFTVHKGLRGKKCITYEEIIEWLKSLNEIIQPSN